MRCSRHHVISEVFEIVSQAGPFAAGNKAASGTAAVCPGPPAERRRATRRLLPVPPTSTRSPLTSWPLRISTGGGVVVWIPPPPWESHRESHRSTSAGGIDRKRMSFPRMIDPICQRRLRFNRSGDHLCGDIHRRAARGIAADEQEIRSRHRIFSNALCKLRVIQTRRFDRFIARKPSAVAAELAPASDRPIVRPGGLKHCSSEALH